MTHLWERVVEAKRHLKPVEPKYRIVYEMPNAPDEPFKVMVPDPNWLASALAGGVLPPIEAHIADHEVELKYVEEHGSLDGFSWDDHNPQHPYADPIGPMTEEEAMEYLVMKDVPFEVWRDYKGNREILAIVPVEAVSTDRTNRNAWKLKQMEAF